MYLEPEGALRLGLFLVVGEEIFTYLEGLLVRLAKGGSRALPCPGGAVGKGEVLHPRNDGLLVIGLSSSGPGLIVSPRVIVGCGHGEGGKNVGVDDVGLVRVLVGMG